ncbi:hypothetical protein A2397_02170 [Candidatus Amesbacteria bacterium RIFOXYB1_FULL_44_23]|uniref:Uncharacterized protein n=1 Tax=Candidatus Amesbacteria bacterium RIFOXYB1_FULL_44_23 TaxID=1797263 RepID=A0A1F4ZSW8_9BACT|nr:MAG: hypothetical protein A2397_02170 [Candidatus Amesbacteria bacterium RIFOXYB1_FULL_44_23]
MSSRSELIQKARLPQELVEQTAFEAFRNVVVTYLPQTSTDLYDFNAVAEQDMGALRMALRVDLMPKDEQKIFDDLTTGSLLGDSREQTPFEHFAEQITEDDVDKMIPKELKGLALRWVVLGIAARVHLARRMVANIAQDSIRPVDDIGFKSWCEIGANTSTMFKIANGRKVIDGRFVFYRILTNSGVKAYLGSR